MRAELHFISAVTGWAEELHNENQNASWKHFNEGSKNVQPSGNHVTCSLYAGPFCARVHVKANPPSHIDDPLRGTRGRNCLKVFSQHPPGVPSQFWLAGFKFPRAGLSPGIDFQMKTTHFPVCTQCIMFWQLFCSLFFHLFLPFASEPSTAGAAAAAPPPTLRTSRIFPLRCNAATVCNSVSLRERIHWRFRYMPFSHDAVQSPMI